MAARLLQRRLASYLRSAQSQGTSSNKILWSSPKDAPMSRYFQVNTYSQDIQTLVEPVLGTDNAAAKDRDAISVSELAETNPDANDGYVKYKASSSLKMSARHDLAMIFTCRVCETRSVKTVCRESYEKGVVVARCGGCNNLHLIADRLGWFGEPGSVEEFLAARGEEVRKGSLDTLNLSLEDLAGRKAEDDTQ
ncbi:hypothetical protein H6P81_017614 [Aristolochia fimbriata]|uniref:DNL-type domain-containing protein n=1 Tax=Aristolochia fimbriata TaxID=158543 RepID=A0AAV7E0N3_ARIFI|nr:hypothetical protein H6P81_017614 [Aristolochia fimbriata]